MFCKARVYNDFVDKIDNIAYKYYKALENQIAAKCQLIKADTEIDREIAFNAVVDGIKSMAEKYGFSYTREDSRFEATEYPFFDSMLKTNNLDYDLISIKLDKGGVNPLSFWVNIIDYSEHLDLPEVEKIKISSNCKPLNCNYFEYKKALFVIESYLSNNFDPLFNKIQKVKTQLAVKAKQKEITKASIHNYIKVLCMTRKLEYTITDYKAKSKVQVNLSEKKVLILDLYYSKFTQQVKDIEKAIDGALLLSNNPTFASIKR